MRSPYPVLNPEVQQLDALDLKWRGLRFVSAETERDFFAWNVTGAVPFIRIGMVGSLLGWLCGIAGVAFVYPGALPWYLSGVAVVSTAIVITLALTAAPRWNAWLFPFTALSNALAGFVGVMAPFHGLGPDMALGGLLIIISFAFTVFRLPWRWALVAAGSYSWTFVGLVLARGYPAEIPPAQRVTMVGCIGVAFLAGALASVVSEGVLRGAFRQERIIEAQRAVIEQERERADRLLHNMLPAPIAARLKLSPGIIADRFEAVTVLFADVVGFTVLAASLAPEKLVEVLNDVFTRFDALAQRYGVEKIKTIGDAYMAVAGIPQVRADHAAAAADLALAMCAALAEVKAKTGFALRLRIGLCSGPAVAGVIGAQKFAYDLWGDTVNTAARMESHGTADEIHLSESTVVALGGLYRLDERGVIDIKGKGPMRTWYLRGPAAP